MGTVGISSLQLFAENSFLNESPMSSWKVPFRYNNFCPLSLTMFALKLVVLTNFMIVPPALPSSRSIYLLYYVDLIIFTGCLPSTENRVHAIQDLCRQGQFSRSVCSTYMFGANTYILIITYVQQLFFSFSNQVSAAEMTNFYRFSMSNQTACARKGKGD